MLLGRYEDAGILHNLIRTRTMFALKPHDLTRGTVRWGTILRAIDRVGSV
jgi:hypothetical protein